VLPLSLIGLGIAIYHNIIYALDNYLYGISDLSLGSCGGGISCTEAQLEWLGFISIPLLSLIGYSTINILMWLSYRHNKGKRTIFSKLFSR
jgi:disulfide bond formation protein DsbB